MTEDESTNASNQLSNLIIQASAVIGSSIESEIPLPNGFAVKDKTLMINYSQLIHPPVEREAAERLIRDESKILL